MKSKEKIKIGDYVKVTNPLPEFEILDKHFRNKIGKVVNISFKDGYRIYFDNESKNIILFYKNEITKISKEEYFMEIL
jgi:hypothetical protein